MMCLENIREKSGNSANARDNQENISAKMFFLHFFTQSITYYAKNYKTTHHAQSVIVGFHFP